MKTEKIFKRLFVLFIAIFLLSSQSCSNKASYIRGTFKKPNIWEKVEIDASKTTPDQQKIISENGIPSYILTFFEANSEGRKGREVHEWVYEKQERFFWFVDGNLVDYMAVKLPKEKRIKPPGM